MLRYFASGKLETRKRQQQLTAVRYRHYVIHHMRLLVVAHCFGQQEITENNAVKA